MRRPSTFFASLVIALALWPGSVAASHGQGRTDEPVTLAVIGDIPYTDAQLAGFPGLVADVNADPNVRAVLHLGDIKGDQVCSDEFLESRRTLYETFDDPFVYTPGDNEWTDCHNPTFGGYIPTERLASLRTIFYPRPGRALGGRRPMFVRPQSRDRHFKEFVENVMWAQSGVVFSTVHVVGSNNDLVPWFGAAETTQQRGLRLAEVDRRTAAALDWLERTFALAGKRRARGIVISMQANLFLARLSPGADVSGFNAIVQRIADLASRFGGEVLLLEGDSHGYLVDEPLTSGSPEHGVTTQAPNVTRIVVQGVPYVEWLRLVIDPRSPQLFSWQREPM
jgi:hypothetical protein